MEQSMDRRESLKSILALGSLTCVGTSPVQADDKTWNLEARFALDPAILVLECSRKLTQQEMANLRHEMLAVTEGTSLEGIKIAVLPVGVSIKAVTQSGNVL